MTPGGGSMRAGIGHRRPQFPTRSRWRTARRCRTRWPRRRLSRSVARPTSS